MASILILFASTVVYLLVFVVGESMWATITIIVGFPFALLFYVFLIPFTHGYVTQKYLQLCTPWSPLIVLSVPVVSTAVSIIYAKSETNWAPLEKASLVISVMVIQSLIVLLGAYARFKQEK